MCVYTPDIVAHTHTHTHCFHQGERGTFPDGINPRGTAEAGSIYSNRSFASPTSGRRHEEAKICVGVGERSQKPGGDRLLAASEQIG